jgi:hypothetical protein
MGEFYKMTQMQIDETQRNPFEMELWEEVLALEIVECI